MLLSNFFNFQVSVFVSVSDLLYVNHFDSIKFFALKSFKRSKNAVQNVKRSNVFIVGTTWFGWHEGKSEFSAKSTGIS